MRDIDKASCWGERIWQREEVNKGIAENRWTSANPANLL